MKIVYITNIPSPYQIKWAEYLRKSHEVEFWFMIDIENSISRRPGYWNVELPSFCKMMPSRYKKYELGYGPTLKKELNKFNPDIVMLGAGWYMISWMQGYRWAVKNKKKILAGPIEFGQNMFKINRIIRNKFIYKFLYKSVDYYLANAYIHYDYFGMALGINNRVLFMNYDQYGPYLDHPTRVGRNHVRFLYAGAIDQRMRVLEVIKVFQKLHLQFPNSELVIGGYGPGKKQCIELVESDSRLRDAVIFHDVKSWDEIPEVYNSCDVLINYASYSPGSGVILAAVASGMPIISMISIHATRHFVLNKYNGFIIENQEMLFAAMEAYFENPTLVENHSQRSKNIGVEKLTFKSHVEDFNRILNSFEHPIKNS